MATFNPRLQMWAASTGGYFSTREEAEAAESSGAGRTSYGDDAEFAGSSGGLASGDSMIRVLGPERTAEDLEADRAARAFREREEELRSLPYGTAQSQGGTATGWQATTRKTPNAQSGTEHITVRQGDMTGPNNTWQNSGASLTRGYTDGVPTGSGYQGFYDPLGNKISEDAWRASPAGRSVAENFAAGTPPSGGVSGRVAETEADYLNQTEGNEFENDSLWSENLQGFRDLTGGDYGLSDEARGYQREGLQMQRDLLSRLFNFDPDAYATQFADRVLARNVALARSSPGGAAAQQAGIFAAMEGAPAAYAEGAREAAALENQRLTQAANVTRAFGELGTLTRGQDEARAQFDAQLPLEIQKAFNDAVQGKMQLNEAEARRFAEVWMNFAELQSVYDRMSHEEQLAWWEREMAAAGLDQQYRMFQQELASGGKVQPRDLLGGLFQLGGGLISGGFSLAAAKEG